MKLWLEHLSEEPRSQQLISRDNKLSTGFEDVSIFFHLGNFVLFFSQLFAATFLLSDISTFHLVDVINLLEKLH